VTAGTQGAFRASSVLASPAPCPTRPNVESAQARERPPDSGSGCVGDVWQVADVAEGLERFRMKRDLGGPCGRSPNTGPLSESRYRQRARCLRGGH
jgi:hypothetical protein